MEERGWDEIVFTVLLNIMWNSLPIHCFGCQCLSDPLKMFKNNIHCVVRDVERRIFKQQQQKKK